MISAKVYAGGSERLRRIRENLKKSSTTELLRTVPTRDLEGRILAKIQEYTPIGRRSLFYQSVLGYPPSTEADKHLRDSWRIRRNTGTSGISFEIWSTHETIGGRRGKAKLRSVDQGSGASSIVVKRKFRFKTIPLEGGKSRWLRFEPGDIINRTARRGLKITNRTQRYIERYILPKFQTKVEEALRKRMQ